MKKKYFLIISLCVLLSMFVVEETVFAATYYVNKKPGEYNSAITVSVKAKKGYNVYYTMGKHFSKSRIIYSGKKKRIKISKSTTLTVFATKQNRKISKNTLKKKKLKSKGCIQYKYTIKKNTSDSTIQNPSATQKPSDNNSVISEKDIEKSTTGKYNEVNINALFN